MSLPFVSAPSHFDTVPSNIMELSHVVGDEATTSELRDFYGYWTKFYLEAASGSYQLPNDLQISHVPEGVTIHPSSSESQDYVQVLGSDINLTIIVKLSKEGGRMVAAERDVSYRRQAQQSIVVSADGVASYQRTESVIRRHPLAPTIIQQNLHYVRKPSLQDIVLFAGVLREITTPSPMEAKKQRLASRIADLFRRSN